jgi:hypothetical protein
MIIFSKVKVTSDTTDKVGEGFVGGEPICYDDLAGWKFFEEVLEACTGPSKILCEVETYGYGEDDGAGTWAATPEEVAYMMQRIAMRPDFLETRCQKTRQPYKVDIRWEPNEIYKFLEL